MSALNKFRKSTLLRRQEQITLGDETINVTLNAGDLPNAVTRKMRDATAFAALDTDPDGKTKEGKAARKFLAEVLSLLIIVWDLKEEDGTPVPTTPEEFEKADTIVLVAIYYEIGQLLNPKD